MSRFDASFSYSLRGDDSSLAEQRSDAVYLLRLLRIKAA